MFDLEFFLQYKYGSSSSHYHPNYNHIDWSHGGNILQATGTDLLSSNYDFFINELKEKALNDPKEMNGVISTRLNGNYEYPGNYILAFDCDGVEEKNRAIKSLNKWAILPDITNKKDKIKGIRYFPIISSCIDNKLHFWIITNYCNFINECIKFMKHIDGIDKNYVKFCEMRQNIVLRAFPKNGQLPIFTKNYDIPINSDVNKWYGEFRKYWQSEDMNIIRQNYFDYFDHTLKFDSKDENEDEADQDETFMIDVKCEKDYEPNFSLLDI